MERTEMVKDGAACMTRNGNQILLYQLDYYTDNWESVWHELSYISLCNAILLRLVMELKWIGHTQFDHSRLLIMNMPWQDSDPWGNFGWHNWKATAISCEYSKQKDDTVKLGNLLWSLSLHSDDVPPYKSITNMPPFLDKTSRTCLKYKTSSPRLWRQQQL